MTDPVIQSARSIFDESLGSLMAHTIRGTQNYFRRHQISLEISIAADSWSRLELQEPRKGVTSILRTRLKKTPPGLMDVVKAGIFIHRNANRTLARVAIAHEIYHLLLELNLYLTNQRKAWQRIPVTKSVEDQCNLFAWELCAMHDKFNRNPDVRDNIIHFPQGFFTKPLNTNAEHQDYWPLGMALDPQNPFFKRPLFDPNQVELSA